MTRNKIVPTLLIIFGVTFVLTSISIWIDKPASTGISGLMATWRGGLAAVSGFVSVVTALIVFFRRDKKSLQAGIKLSAGSPQFAAGEPANNNQGTIIEKQVIEPPENGMIGPQYQNIHTGVTPRQVAEDELKAALARLAELPEDEIPAPAPMPKGSRFPNLHPNPLFVGRQPDLRQLAEWLKQDRS